MGQIALELRTARGSSLTGYVEEADRLFTRRIPGMNSLRRGFQLYSASLFF